MKHTLLLFGTVAVALASCLCASAQNTDTYPEYRQFRETAGRRSAVFRGKEATRYQFRYNGNYYWDSPVFETGDIYFEGRFYPGISINVDAVRQEVLVKDGDDIVPIALSPHDVDSFSMGERKFICVDGAIREVLHEGPRAAFYRNVKKTLSTSPENVNGDDIGYSDPDYKYEVITYFAYAQTLFLVKDGSGPVVIRTRAALKRQLRDRRKDIKALLAANPGLLDLSLAEYCSQILEGLGL